MVPSMYQRLTTGNTSDSLMNRGMNPHLHAGQKLEICLVCTNKVLFMK